MANTFRVATKSTVSTSRTTPSTIYTVPASTTSIVLALLITNIHTSSIKASIVLSSDTFTNVDVHIIKDVVIEQQTSLELMAGQKYVLQETDILKIYADNANLDATLSYMEIT